MKYIYSGLLIMFFMPLDFICGQEFKKTSDYHIDLKIYGDEYMEDYKEDGYYQIKNKSGKTKARIPYYSEVTETFSIKIFENPKLKNIKRILKIEMDGCVCMCSRDYYLWLIDKEGKWHQLPLMSIFTGDKSNHGNYFHYAFPEKENVNKIKALKDIDKPYKKQKLSKVVVEYQWDGSEISCIYKSLNTALKDPEKVEVLDLSGQKLNNFPVNICRFNNLKKLNLSDNNIKYFPFKLCELKKLKQLNLSANNLDSFPIEICKFSNLEILNLSKNNLVSLASEISALKNLKTLDIKFNDLIVNPEEISK
jgi:hypothetical protein